MLQACCEHILLTNCESCTFQLAEGALAHELVSNGLSALYHTLLARLHIQNENYDEAEENLNQALKLDHQVRISGMHRDTGMHIETLE